MGCGGMKISKALVTKQLKEEGVSFGLCSRGMEFLVHHGGANMTGGTGWSHFICTQEAEQENRKWGRSFNPQSPSPVMILLQQDFTS